jgi:hypothetical protein
VLLGDRRGGGPRERAVHDDLAQRTLERTDEGIVGRGERIALDDGESRRLLDRETDVGQEVLLARNAIALVAMLVRGFVDDRNTQRAEFGLVAIETLLERLGAGRIVVSRDAPTDVGERDRTPRAEEKRDEIEQPLGLGDAHGLSARATGRRTAAPVG